MLFIVICININCGLHPQFILISFSFYYTFNAKSFILLDLLFLSIVDPLRKDKRGLIILCRGFPLPDGG